MPPTATPSSPSTSGHQPGSTPRSQPTAPRRGRPRRSVVGASLVLLASVLGVTVWAGLTGGAPVESTTIRPVQEVERIQVDVEAGAIDIVSGDDVLVEVASGAGRWGAASVTARDVSDGVLAVTVSCSRLALLRTCDTPVSLVVPPGTPLVAATGAGMITASGLTAGADLRAAAGAIDVRDLEGDIRLRSDAGSLSGTVLRGTVDASTSAGSISITVVEDITSLSATTELGAVELYVPEATYRVDTGTTLGRTDIGVETAADAARVVEARSEVGDVTVRTGTRNSTGD